MVVKKRSTKRVKRATRVTVAEPEALESFEALVDARVKQKEEEAKAPFPGAVVRGIKRSWTRSDVDAAFPAVNFVPEETIPVTFQGVRYQLIEGIENCVPSKIRDIYYEHRQIAKQGSRDILRSLGIDANPGAGALPPE